MPEKLRSEVASATLSAPSESDGDRPDARRAVLVAICHALHRPSGRREHADAVVVARAEQPLAVDGEVEGVYRGGVLRQHARNADVDHHGARARGQSVDAPEAPRHLLATALKFGVS